MKLPSSASLVRAFERPGLAFAVSAGPGAFITGSLSGLPATAAAWLTVGRRIIPLSPEEVRIFTFSTRPGLKLVTAWTRPASAAPARARAVARRLVRVSGLAPSASSAPPAASPPDRPPPPRVTVVVPNYNHAPYLRRRLDSLYAQTRAPDEILLLDDASTDDSAALLADYARRDPVPGRTRLLLNSVNSGGPFAQWALGLREARGDLVWITESDDWCADDFLARLLPAFTDPAVLLAHGLTTFVDANEHPVAQTHDKVFRPLPSRKWRRSHVDSAHREINLGLGVRNLIPNASAVVFRRPAGLPLLDDPEWRALRVCGDWIFYLHLLRGGKIAFVREALNYYRVHAANTSRQPRQEACYQREHALVARHLAATYRLATDVIPRQLALLQAHQARRQSDTDQSAPPASIRDCTAGTLPAAARAPNVLVAIHAFTPGGAEQFALQLALAFRRLGCAVTIADFARLPADPVVRALVPADVAVVRLDENRPRDLARFLRDFGIEWVSTHHPCCDIALALATLRLPRAARPRLFCTHHGYYHLDAARLFAHRALFDRAVDRWVNVSARGRLPFEVAGLASSGPDARFVQIPAAVFQYPVASVSRASLDLPDTAFVVCVASRALPEKGWREAIAAVAAARAETGLDLRLILAGSGPVHDSLHAEGTPAFVRLLGFRADVPALYATANLGLLATTYAGESCPLSVIECLAAGRAVVVTAIGETPAMLASTDGGQAGALIPPLPAEEFVPRLAAAISAFATDPALLAAAADRAPACARPYDLMAVAARYLALYRDLPFTDILPSPLNSTA